MTNLKYFYFLAILCISSSVQGYSTYDITVIAATKNRFPNQNSVMAHRVFEEIFSPCLQLAQQHCQNTFVWDKWNCPREDFRSKRMSRSLDRETAFVSAITTASLIYTITKNCTLGNIPGCGCAHSMGEGQICCDNTKFAENIADNLLNEEEVTTDAYGYAILHNIRAAKIAVAKSMQKLCRCQNILTKSCENQICWTALGPFDVVARELRQMYDRAVLVEADNRGQVNWSAISEYSLAFILPSPNYCDLNAIPNWSGMIERQCSRSKGRTATLQEKRSCRNLCRSCGLKVYERTMLVERRCNCKFSWCCEVTCDICYITEKEYYCG